MLNIAIIGGGAIGLLTACLLEKDHHVTLYIRDKQQYKVIEKEGIICLPVKKRYPISVQMISRISANHELIIIAVKAYHLQVLVKQLKQLNVPLLFIQNGMSHLSVIKEALAEHITFIATVEHGARKEGLNGVTHTGIGNVNVAPYGLNAKQKPLIIQRLATHSFPIKVMQDGERLLKEKVMINAVINPITAVYQVRNGAILTDPRLHEEAKNLAAEVARVLALNFNEQWQRIVNIASRTSRNDSSMKVDIDQGRCTEVDGILGYLINLASSPIPKIIDYYQAIKEMERGDQ
ncbi:2-dehydropantoate 2-reductase [Amphibacillus marinus]|uniref:2-dehydropantoate 2-reductase n=1 Tax=Amphibacillus marinus TaxID=872970 RepID=A0A1H8I6S6_9BACI|nr:2-dehydropantoate 2-reductase [Amphibacillus marinus]SEN63815.1 2-dehydropantoate 2-reductase [Amphibacillus marinus]